MDSGSSPGMTTCYGRIPFIPFIPVKLLLPLLEKSRLPQPQRNSGLPPTLAPPEQLPPSLVWKS